ncbi:MAG TPA: Ku protein [Terriglobales bacterium]|nr:Ku protein [Terriglobales bacterium]
MATSVWKGHLTFGLVSLPIKLFSAARSETISFNQLHKTDHSRVKQVLYCAAEDKPVAREDLVKGYEYEKGRYVIVDSDEIQKVAPKTAQTMEILEFVKSSEIDPLYFESSYYMAPDAAGEKAYALLFEALRRTGYVGVAKVAMHSREHIVILRPGEQGLVLHTMYYADEVRKVEEFRTNTDLVAAKELELAQLFVRSLEAKFEPEKYHDEYRDNLKALIKAKVEGQAIVEPEPAPKLAPVVDIMAALRASMEKIGQKKPVQSTATEPVAEKPKRAKKATAK